MPNSKRLRGRPKHSVPSYRLHKSTGQAVCYINRTAKYLGIHDTPESRLAYAKLLTELQAESGKSSAHAPGRMERTVSELLLKFASDPEGLPKYSNAEQHCLQGVIRIVRTMFGDTMANDFGPLRLRAVRESMLQGEAPTDGTPKKKLRKPWSHSFTNRQVKRLRHIFRLGVSWEYLSQTVVDALGSVPSLNDPNAGSRQRTAVPNDNLQAVREKLSKQLHVDLFDLMLLTGSRPGELLGSRSSDGLRTCDLDRRGEVWRVDLKKHKTTHKGKSRTLYFHPKAQLILRRYLRDDAPEVPMFSIRRDHFGKVVRSACEAAGVPEFTPHWIRHTVATKTADDMGIEAAQRLVGHASSAMTEHYTKAAEKLAIEASRRLG